MNKKILISLSIFLLLGITSAYAQVIDKDVPVNTRDQVILDDLIVDGSTCVGFDCVNGENFGFSTILLKENNLRIKFDDTSNSASFPNNDWQITINDTNNGGANKFSIDDITGGRTPFTIEAGAPSHSLYVDDGGRLGLGTSTPVTDIHVKSGNTPTLRLEQDGSSGFTPQTWDLAGNETNFFVRDATNGSRLPFRIRPSAPSNSIFVDTDGDVGLGTSSPLGPLHIENTGGDDIDDFVVTNDGNVGIGTVSPQATYKLDVRGALWLGPQGSLSGPEGGEIVFEGTTGNDNHFLDVFNSDARLFTISGGANKLSLFSTVGTYGLDVSGDIAMSGVVLHASDKTLKKNMRKFDRGLYELLQLDPISYEYNGKGGLFNDRPQVGLIAQKLMEVAPELVQSKKFTIRNQKGEEIGDEEYLAIRDNEIKYLMINAIKDQQDIIQEQKEEIDDLKELVYDMSSRVEKLEQNRRPNINIELRNGASLGQNYPNPYSQETQVEYYLPSEVQSARIVVLDVSGRLISSKSISKKGSGIITFNAEDLPKGQYTYSLEVDGQLVDTKKMIVAYK